MGAIERLCDIEEIRQVKHRYLRGVDLKLWEEIGDTLTQDATLDPGTSAFGKLAEITGRPEIIAFLRARLGPAMLTGHTASQPEITVDGDTAAGIWSHHETVLATRHRMVIASTGFCEERYERGADARWRIARTSCVRTCEVMASLDDLPSFKIIAALGGELPESTHEDPRPPADMAPARAWGSNGATAHSAAFSAGRPPAGTGTGNGQ